MVMPALPRTPKPLVKVIQRILQHQKRHFKMSFIGRIDKKLYGNNVAIDQSSSNKSNVQAISDPTTQNKPTVGYGSGVLGKPEGGYSAGTNVNHPELMSKPKDTQAFTGDSPVSTAFETGKPMVLRDLQAEVSNRVVGVFQNNRAAEVKEHLPGQGRVSSNGLVDPTTVQQVFYFDTLANMKKLEAKGFSREQAEVCVECLVEIINSTLDHQARHMITKSQQEIAVLQLLSEIISVKKDMVLLQKSEFSSLRSETEKISIDMKGVQTHFQDEVVKLKGQFTLDINLERGRAVEAHAENEKKLQLLHNKIDTEIANLKTTFEIYRNDVIKFAGGTVLTCATLILGFIRLWK